MSYADASMKQKLVINLNILDNHELLPLIHSATTKYAAAKHNSGTIMRYFANGVELLQPHEFRKKYASCSNYKPISNWIIVMSLSSMIEPNNSTIIKFRNKICIIASCELTSITQNGKIVPDPGSALNPNEMTYGSTDINYRTGVVRIKSTIASDKSLVETVYNVIPLINNIVNPFVRSFTDLTAAVKTDLYSTEEGRVEMYNLLKSILTNLHVRSPNALQVRERLTHFLNETEDPYTYVHQGVAFDNRNEFDAMMRTYNDEELVLRIKTDKPILERLLKEYPTDHDARLKEITNKRIITDRPADFQNPVLNFLIGLTDDEFAEVSKTPNDTQEYKDLVIRRWEKVHAA